MQANKELIGNAMVLIANRCKPLYHTKLLKLLYLIDEVATIKTGAPITWLTYNAWQYGPVAEDIYYSKRVEDNKFGEYVKFDYSGENRYVVKPVVKFNDAEFTDLDLIIIDEVLQKYGLMSTKELIETTHAEGSLWNKTVKCNNIHFSETNKTSNTPLDFAKLVENDGFKKTIYFTTKENIELKAILE